jgi:hypothetical protein
MKKTTHGLSDADFASPSHAFAGQPHENVSPTVDVALPGIQFSTNDTGSLVLHIPAKDADFGNTLRDVAEKLQSSTELSPIEIDILIDDFVGLVIKAQAMVYLKQHIKV